MMAEGTKWDKFPESYLTDRRRCITQCFFFYLNLRD